ncbi:MAG: NTF2 fold immunity protein [Sphingomonas sp.]
MDDVPELPKVETPPVIPNSQTAVRIAEAYFQSRLPAPDPQICRLEASLTNGVWHVGGVLPPDSLGGCLHIEICQLNGRVLRAWGEQ